METQSESPEPGGTPSGTFEFNRPVLVGLLFLATWFTGFAALVALVLAYVWRGDEEGVQGSWRAGHYRYLIRTFWIALLYAALILAFVLLVSLSFMSEGMHVMHAAGPGMGASALFVLVVLAGFGTVIWSTVRCTLSIANAARRRPMPRPGTWWI